MASKNKGLVAQKPKSVSKGKWKKIHELKNKISDTDAKINKLSLDKKALFEKAAVELTEIEIKHCQIIKGAILELIRFIPYKSLSDSRFEGLMMWIQEYKALIENNPFNAGEDHVSVDDIMPLQQAQIKFRFDKFDKNPATTLNPELSMQAQINNVIKVILDSLARDNHKTKLLLNKAQCIALIIDPSLREDIFTHPFFKTDANYVEQRNELGEFEFSEEELFLISEAIKQQSAAMFDEEIDFDATDSPYEHKRSDHSDFHQYTDDHPLSEADAEKWLNNEEINKLYRQLAHKFHPDKVTNEEDKSLYLDLMKELSSAKKTKSFHTIIELAMTYLPELEIDLSADTFDLMLLSLERKLSEAQEHLHQLKYEDITQEGLVWAKFQGRTKKQTELNIQNHKAQLENRLLELYHIFFARPLTIKQVNRIIDDLKRRHLEDDF